MTVAWSTFAVESNPLTGDILVGLRSGVNVGFAALGFAFRTSFAGNPNTHVAGVVGDFCIDTSTNPKNLYMCTTAGNSAAAVWTLQSNTTATPWFPGAGSASGVGGNGTVSASGDNSFAFGSNATHAQGTNSLAFGDTVTSTGNFSLAFGNNNTLADGLGSVALGNSVSALGAYSFCMGSNGSGAAGDYSFAFGNNSATLLTHSVAWGNEAAAQFAGSWVLGDSNATPPLDSAANQMLQCFAGGYYWFLNNTPTLAAAIDSSGNLINKKATADQSYSSQAPTTGFSITIGAGVKTLLLNPAGTLATGTVIMPASPIDGQEVRIASSKQITALTITPNAGQTLLNAFTGATLAAGFGLAYIYNLGSTRWENTLTNADSVSGTVTSVSFTGDGVLFKGSAGTPVTTSGTLTPQLINQVKNTFLSGPLSGADAAPTFRTFALADMPTQTTLTLLGNITGGTAVPVASTLTAIIDACIGSTQGDILYRNATVWTVLAPSTNGFFLKTQGAGANPVWASAGVAASAINAINVVKITTTSTYTPSAGLVEAFVQIVGGGGAGGGIPNTTSGVTGASAGTGGAGGYTQQTFPAATIGASQAVTIGAGGTPGSAGNNPGGNGGTTSFGALLSATGGIGGSGQGAVSAGQISVAAGGTGGLGSGGDFVSFGGNGDQAVAGFYGACGGRSYFGPGGQSAANAAGVAGTNYGSGG